LLPIPLLLTFIVLEKGDFKKLDVNLPTQPVVDSKPWGVAGWIWAALILAFALLFYFLR
jgi:hypothetical protein